ncbi:hypothetical protein AYO38_03500 [bacterium SCGC AG-212-C10]|nr:hypothetical protein AYO38_03500 [bacterium SCGC AG-212-C10]
MITPTLFRLAFAGIRSRGLTSILAIALAAAASATIVLALEVGATTADPWRRTFEAAHGAHVLADVETLEQADTIAGMPGVELRADPVAVTLATLSIEGRTTRVILLGLDHAPAVNAPVQTEGTGPVDGGAVLERSLARVLGLEPGMSLDLSTPAGKLAVSVSGTAISPAQPRYPRSNPGVIWVTRSDFEQIQPDRASWHWQQALRLTDATVAPQFADAAAAQFPPGTVFVASWQNHRELAMQEAQPIQLVLVVYTLLLLFVSMAITAILTGARVSSQYREIGLLKAIGLTPMQVNLIFVFEALALGVAGVVLGFIPGALLAPRLTAAASESLLGSPTVNANPMHMLVAGIIILPLIAGSAFATARRATRGSTLQAIRAGSPLPQATSRLGRLIWQAAWLPIAVTVGLKDLLSRRSRAAWLMCAIIVTGAALVVTFCVQAALGDRPPGQPSDFPGELLTLILSLDAILAVISLSTLIALSILSIRERIRDLGVLSTVGLTPTQIALSATGAHVALAFVASIVAVPAGIALFLLLYTVASGEGASGPVVAPWWWLLSLPLAIALATAIAVSLPARLAARIAPSDAVRYE